MWSACVCALAAYALLFLCWQPGVMVDCQAGSACCQVLCALPQVLLEGMCVLHKCKGVCRRVSLCVHAQLVAAAFCRDSSLITVDLQT